MCIRDSRHGLQVRFGEVAVVVSLFLAAQRGGGALHCIECARLLLDGTTGREDLRLALRFVLDGALNVLEAVEVLHLAAVP